MLVYAARCVALHALHHGTQQIDTHARESLLGFVNPRCLADVTQHRQQGRVGVLPDQQRVGHTQHWAGVDDDKVELNNLQRQVLFDEQDIADQLPKAIAAANKLRQIYNGYRSSPESTLQRLYEDARRILLSQAQIDATAEELRLDQILGNLVSGGAQ